ncbi:MAG: NifU family protein [Pirellulales bacterium]
MSDTQIQIRGEPFSNVKCKFIVDRPVYDGRSHYFANAQQADGSPLATALFAIEGVSNVLISHNEITVGKATMIEWPVIGKQVGGAIRAHLESGAPAVGDSLRAALPPETEIRAKVERVLAEEVNPWVGQHGGVVRLVDVRENTVFLQMGGGCQGCGSATATLRLGVETAIRASVPAVGDIRDVTDHAAGRNPYYAPQAGQAQPQPQA